MATPIDEITDGDKFQRIVAAYFECLKKEKLSYNISNVDVSGSGVGPDNGCDILVEFHFEDVIHSHTQKWVIECKCHKRAIGKDKIDTNNIHMLLENKGATGFLLVCKSDATSHLKEFFEDNKGKGKYKFLIWNGDQFWHKCCEFKSLIESFFPDYYKKKYQDNNAESRFSEVTSDVTSKIQEGK